MFKAILMLISCLGLSSIFAEEQKENLYHQDLEFIRKTLIDNHPGIYNPLDPDFLVRLEQNYKIAEEKLSLASSDKEKELILREFGNRFEDTHLWVTYASKTPVPILHKTDPFSIEALEDGVQWIRIPNFRPSDDEIGDVKRLIQSLPELRGQNVVFDLRGNSGGNSKWGEEILEALFGEGYAKKQLANSRLNESKQWRVSQENVDYVKSLIPFITKQFGETHSIVSAIEDIHAGMQKALSLKECYYSEPQELFPANSETANNLFNGHAMAVIDSSCGSSCLVFLDGLRAMEANVLFFGETTSADTVYIELRRVDLPSKKGRMGFPIKMCTNRLRGHNVPYTPDIAYENLQDTKKLQEFSKKLFDEPTFS